MKYPYITVHNFGVFTIKHWALQKEKEKLINEKGEFTSPDYTEIYTGIVYYLKSEAGRRGLNQQGLAKLAAMGLPSNEPTINSTAYYFKVTTNSVKEWSEAQIKPNLDSAKIEQVALNQYYIDFMTPKNLVSPFPAPKGNLQDYVFYAKYALPVDSKRNIITSDDTYAPKKLYSEFVN